jgi:predicted deacylase
MFRTKRRLGEIVKKGDRLGWVADPFGSEDCAVVTPVDGLIIGMLHNPLVHRGDAVMHLACAADIDVAEGVLDAFGDDYSLNN